MTAIAYLLALLSTAVGHGDPVYLLECGLGFVAVAALAAFFVALAVGRA